MNSQQRSARNNNGGPPRCVGCGRVESKCECEAAQSPEWPPGTLRTESGWDSSSFIQWMAGNKRTAFVVSAIGMLVGMAIGFMVRNFLSVIP